jgi:ribosomal protein S18 acetylase RimI-like enzyme
MTVRMLLPGDEELLRDVVLRFKGGSPQPQVFLADDACRAWVAESNGAVAAWCWGQVLSRPDGRRDLLLYELEVSPSGRRRGHGRALVEAALEFASEAGLGEMWLLADDDNVAALSLYRSLGGAEVSQMLFSWWVGEAE